MGSIWTKSGSVEFDNNGAVAPGALAYFFIGNTTTPLAVYEDAGESTPHEHPLEADGNGRWPSVFIPFIASYDVKVTTEAGTQLYYPQEIPNPDPVEAVADSVDASEIAQTGDIKFRHAGGALDGWVRCNAKTIGSAASGATERANADCADLYAYLWNNFANSILAVTGGRGGSAASDFAANKPISLFDLRSGTPFGVADMGSTDDHGRSDDVAFFTGNKTTGGSASGSLNTATLAEANLPAHAHAVSLTTGTESADHTHSISLTSGTESQSHTHSGTTSSDGSHNHTLNNATNIISSGGTVFNLNASGAAGSAATITITDGAGAHTHTMTTGNASQTHTHSVSGTSGGKSATHTHSVSGNTGNGSGAATPINIVQYGNAGTWYIKL